MRRLTHLVVLAAFVFSCGGHWGALQCIAWANMIREYSEVVPLAQAVHMTLSGDYPCSICKAIADKKSSEQQKALALDKYDKKFVTPVSVAVMRPNAADVRYAVFSTVFQSRTDSPPVPPPRLVLG